MDAEIAIVDATPQHFPAIVRIERAAGEGSVVALTEGHALDEALQRGHYVLVALVNTDVVGWIWFSVDGARGGEEIGQLYRVTVDDAAQARSGIGHALVEHAQALLAARHCTRMRVVLAADDAATRTLLTGLGYELDAVIMERAL